MARDIVETIAGLLAKAEGTDNPHEAETYTRKAEELMLKHNIDQAIVASKRPGQVRDEIVMERIPVQGQYAAALIRFGTIVTEPFSLKTYATLTTGKGVSAVSWIWLVGHKSDIDQATVLINSLLIQSEHAMQWWWDTEGRNTCAHLGPSKKYAARREFFFAFCSGARQRLLETRKRVVEQTGNGAELVLVDRSKKVDAWADQNVETSKTRAGRAQAGDYSARVAGHAAGREAVGQRSLT